MTNADHSDLEALRRTETVPTARSQRSLWARGTALVLGLGAIAAAYVVLEPLLFPPRTVRLAAVQPVEMGTARRASAVEAAGWVEADPFPVTVRPLVPGVVASLNVLEGQEVVQDETVIATLRNAELENALAVASSTLALRRAEWEVARAIHETARELLEQKLDLRQAVARHEGDLAAAEAAIVSAEAGRAGAEAALETARLDLRALESLEGAGTSTPLALSRARARIAEAEAAVRTAFSEVVRRKAEARRVEDLLALAREGAQDPRALVGRVREAASDEARALAARDLAQTAVDVAQRNVALLTVRAPMSGIVLRLDSAPGSAAGPEGQAIGSSEEGTGSTGQLGSMSGGLVTLYDPARLQARVDVQLGDVGGIGAGTEVEIEADSAPGQTFRGVVYRLQREADLLKNTLQVKVRIHEPGERLRPEMLVRARFLVEEMPDARAARGPSRGLVPATAVHGDAVFVFDPRGGGRARRVRVEVIGRVGDLVEIEGPLGPGHKVILDAVSDGEKVRGTP